MSSFMFKVVEYMEVKQVTEWKETIDFLLESKQSEFHQLGYKQATKAEIWNCLFDKIWKGDIEKRLHEIVQDILHLKAGTYMSYMTVSSLQTNEDDIHASIKAVMGSEQEIKN